MTDWISEHPDVLVAICAAAISLISLMVAISSLWIQRSHNYHTIRPIAHFSRGDYEDNIFVKLKNYGAGPLIVESFHVECLNKSTHQRLIDALNGVSEEFVWKNFTDAINGRALAPGAQFVLIEAQFEESEEDVKQEIRETLANLTLHLRYKDVYNRAQPAVTESLSWFGRR